MYFRLPELGDSMKRILRRLAAPMSADEGEGNLAAVVAQLRKQLANHKHAFETTAADRQRWKTKTEQIAATLDWVLDNAALLNECEMSPMQGSFPQLICVGAQKCATSFLYSAIREHPAVSVAPKDRGVVSTEYPIAFEAGLIERPDGPERVLSANPDARILICIRDPLDRAISEYKMRVRAGRETRSFQEAIEAREQSGLFAYVRRSQYVEDIARWQAAFQNVLVLSADDDTKGNLWRLFSFAGFRDRDALIISSNPPFRYAESSSGEAQASRTDMTAEQRELHEVGLSADERQKIRETYFGKYYDAATSLAT